MNDDEFACFDEMISLCFQYEADNPYERLTASTKMDGKSIGEWFYTIRFRPMTSDQTALVKELRSYNLMHEKNEKSAIGYYPIRRHRLFSEYSVSNTAYPSSSQNYTISNPGYLISDVMIEPTSPSTYFISNITPTGHPDKLTQKFQQKIRVRKAYENQHGDIPLNHSLYPWLVQQANAYEQDQLSGDQVLALMELRSWVSLIHRPA